MSSYLHRLVTISKIKSRTYLSSCGYNPKVIGQRLLVISREHLDDNLGKYIIGQQAQATQVSVYGNLLD